MAEFQEDMLFKNVSDEDVGILIELLGKKSKKVKPWTKELRHIDPKNFRHDLILELDDENLILEFQSTDVVDDFSRRGHSYVAITDQNKKNKKEVNLVVLSTVEDSKIVEYKVNKLNVFRYEVFGLNNLDSEEIINNVKKKIKDNKLPNGREIILLSLVPLSKKGENIVEYIYRVVNIIIKLKNLTISQKDLAFGIMWLTTDKFVEDSLERNIICDLLGDRMSLIHEYVRNKEIKAEDRMIRNFLRAGNSSQKIAKDRNIPLSRVRAIERTLNSKK